MRRLVADPHPPSAGHEGLGSTSTSLHWSGPALGRLKSNHSPVSSSYGPYAQYQRLTGLPTISGMKFLGEDVARRPPDRSPVSSTIRLTTSICGVPSLGISTMTMVSPVVRIACPLASTTLFPMTTMKSPAVGKVRPRVIVLTSITGQSGSQPMFGSGLVGSGLVGSWFWFESWPSPGPVGWFPPQAIATTKAARGEKKKRIAFFMV